MTEAKLKVDGRRKYDTKFREMVVRLYEEGMSQKAIEKAYGVSGRTIRKILATAGVAVRTRSVLTRVIEAQILTDWENGVNKHDIASSYSMSPSTVDSVLKRFDMPFILQDGKFFKTMPGQMIEWAQEIEKKLADGTKELKTLPYWHKFCRNVIHVNPKLMLEWVKKGRIQYELGDELELRDEEEDYRELVVAFDAVQDIYEEMLIDGGLNKRFQAIMSIFVAKNKTSLKDVKAIELTGKDGKELMMVDGSLESSRLDDLDKQLGLKCLPMAREITPKEAFKELNLIKKSRDSQ